jgi:hypothetical protein
MTEGYSLGDLPLDPIDPGTTVLVAGPKHDGARALALELLAGPEGEGAIVVTTNKRAARIADDCARYGVRVTADSAGIIDCVGDEEPDVPARLLTVSSPSDLTGIGMRFSDLHAEFHRAGLARVRTGLYSLSTLLTFSDLRTVSRFVHTLVSRIERTDGFGVLLLDPATHDEQAVSTIGQFCTGRIDVRAGEDGPALRASGLANQTREWRAFDPS